MPNRRFNFEILVACAMCGWAACSDGDHGGLRPASSDAGDEQADGSDADAQTRELEVQRWVGRAAGTDVQIGVVVEGGERARIFFCGGPTSYRTATRWITVELGDGGSYAFEDADWRVTGSVERTSVRGEVSLGGRENAMFEALPIAPGTLAGLYEGRSDCGRVGLIVTHEEPSEEPMGQGACVGEGHLPEQVNPILPIALVDGAIRVRIGETEASVQEASVTPRPLVE